MREKEIPKPEQVAVKESPLLKVEAERTVRGWKIQVLGQNKGAMISPEGVTLQVYYNHFTGTLLVTNTAAVFNQEAVEGLEQMLRHRPR
jgi:hypothetical protein